MPSNNSIIESVILTIKQNQTAPFLQAFTQAQQILITQTGYISHSLHQCIENPHQFLLTITWKTLKNHTHDFKQSKDYQQWKTLLHHFYDPFPKVLHYKKCFHE
tara:strand:- start:49 stop:360 length:312 start_codon:yes stop_codon:yes gene_type:complete